jgi:hypothetical protein
MAAVVAKKREGCRIIHPKRNIKVKSKTWTRIFGSYKTYVDVGDVTIEPTEEEINQFLEIEKLIQL